MIKGKITRMEAKACITTETTKVNEKNLIAFFDNNIKTIFCHTEKKEQKLLFPQELFIMIYLKVSLLLPVGVSIKFH